MTEKYNSQSPNAMYMLSYLGGFSTNYIILRNADIFRKYISHKETFFVKENEESFEIS
jgi:hypothetical protein